MGLQSEELSGSGPPGGPFRLPRRRARGRLALLAAASGLAALAASFAFWDPLDIDERFHVRRLTAQGAEGVRADLEAEMRSLLHAHDVLARSWAGRPFLTREVWRYEAAIFLAEHPSCVLVELIDERRTERWRLARQAGGDARLPAAVLDGLARRARESGEPSPLLTPSFLLPAGRLAAAVVAAGGRASTTVTVIDLEAALGDMLGEHRTLGYFLSLHDGAAQLYRTPEARTQVTVDAVHDAELRLPGVAWRLLVWPDPRLLAQTRTSLPELGAVLGALIGLLLLPAVHFARATLRRSRERGFVDLTERRVRERRSSDQQADEKLRAEAAERGRAEAALQDLSGRLLRVQDEERRRLARELHDSTAQTLGAVAVVLDRARRCARGRDGAEVDAVIEESAGLIGQVTQEIRTMSFLLHPPLLDDLGLEYALPWYAEGFSRRSGIAVSLDVPRDLGRLPAEVEVTLYRIVQEGLANVHQHSGSPTASITVFRDAVSVTLEIADRGRGLRIGTGAELGVGVAGMRERVRQLRGEFEIQGDDGGTVVRVALPLAAVAPASRRSEHDVDVAV